MTGEGNETEQLVTGIQRVALQTPQSIKEGRNDEFFFNFCILFFF